MKNPSSWPQLGCGVGLRTKYYPLITQEQPPVAWFEAISENYMDSGGRPIATLEEVRRHYPVALHGVSLSIGSVDPLDPQYLERLKVLVHRIEPAIVSDHLCWTKVDGENIHDLLPLPFTEEAIRHVAQRVEQVQNFLGRRILLENVSSYVTYRHSVMPEWEFLAEVAKRSGCGILLDLNNIYVNAVNHRFDPFEYLRHIPGELVGQFHLAGHTDRGAYLFDTHSAPVIEPVWNLYREALQLYGPISTLIEWDENLPEFSELMQEVKKAEVIYDQACTKPFMKEAACPPKADPTRDDEPKSGTPPLQQLLRWMKSRILLTNQKMNPDSLETFLNPQGGEPGIERLLVYAEGYPARIREALADIYEAVHHVLGEEKFTELAEAYARNFPSRYYNLTDAGCHLPEFLKSWPWTQTFPFLCELARFEWQVSQAFHAFEEPPLDPTRLADLTLEDWGETRLRFQASVSLMVFEWPVVDLWKARKLSLEEVKPDLFTKKTQRVLLARNGLLIRAELLNEQQYPFLQNLLAGKTLGEACEALSLGEEEELPPVAQWFASWIQEGIVRCAQASSML